MADYGNLYVKLLRSLLSFKVRKPHRIPKVYSHTQITAELFF